MRILSHPFRLRPDGSVATVEQETDEAHAEQLACLVLTRLGERDLAPGFGISDPTFAGIEASEIAAGVAAFGPPVDVTDVRETPRDDGRLDVVVTFTTDDDES